MSKFVTLHGFGGGAPANSVELNFAVVGGTTEPSNPTENMIWVNTDTEITGWVFSMTEPSNLENGTVWIKTNISSDVKFNSLKDNYMEIHPISAMQYIDNAFVGKTAKTYQDGEWVDWGIKVLGMNKNLWASTPKMTYSKNHNNNADGALTFSSSSSGDCNAWAGIYYTEPIELGSYSKLSVTGTWKISYHAAYGISYVYLGVTNNLNMTSISGCAAYRGGSTGTVELDVSGLNGEYYVVLVINNGDYSSCSMVITDITLTA